MEFEIYILRNEKSKTSRIGIKLKPLKNGGMKIK